MALSEAEKDWLERREVYFKYYCRHCQFFKPYDAPHVIPGYCQGDSRCCPVNGKDILCSMQEAAEFEARVAQRLVQNISWPCYAGLCPGGKDMDWQICPKEEWCHMKYARIAVEQEMDDADRS